MAPKLSCEVSETVWKALEDERRRTGGSLSAVVERALAAALAVDSHSIFQVSTSNALIKGVFRGAVTVESLKEHGDLGLGTFDGLDGELIMLDGNCYRATYAGAVNVVDDATRVPFAVVTRFHEDAHSQIEGDCSLAQLTELVDRLRPSENLFAAVRAEGRFNRLMLRSACPAAPGEGLVDAVQHQSEFALREGEGTLVGFWAPVYAGAVNIPGYHFHFISTDRNLGGHVLDLEASGLAVGVQVESELHLAMPHTPEFLGADLSGQHAAALHQAETATGMSEAE
ncbi:MAG TPA: acetolactate decarboxylase [Acidimicrobiia bacterium]|nr:acetolactate decarboxylase [Acidimicrobiia bacterium]